MCATDVFTHRERLHGKAHLPRLYLSQDVIACVVTTTTKHAEHTYKIRYVIINLCCIWLGVFFLPYTYRYTFPKNVIHWAYINTTNYVNAKMFYICSEMCAQCTYNGTIPSVLANMYTLRYLISAHTVYVYIL